MLRILIVVGLLLLFVNSNLLCQSNALNYSIGSFSFENVTDMEFFNSFVFLDESGIFVLGQKPIGAKNRNFEIYIQHFDKNLSLLGMEELMFQEQDSKAFKLETIMNLNNTLCAFYSVNDKVTGKSHLYYESIDKERLCLNSDTKKIAELDLAAHIESDLNRFHLVLSPDSSKLLIYNLANPSNKRNETIQVKVYDEEIIKIIEFELNFNYSKSEIFIRQVACDNYGNVAVLAVTSTGYIIQYYDSEGTFVYETSISNSSQNLYDSRIRFERNHVVFFSFITSQQTLNVKGFYYFVLNPVNGSYIVNNMSEFPKEFLYKNMLNGEIKVIEKDEEREQTSDLMKYNVKHMIPRNDDGLIVIAEQTYMEKSNSSSGASSPGSSTKIYYCNDIIVLSIAPDGTTEWQNKVGKRQREIISDDFENSLFVSPLKNWSTPNLDPQKYLSFSYAYFDDELMLFYNDHEKNSSLEFETVPVTCYGKHSSTVFSCVKIDDLGNMKKMNLFNCKEEKCYPMPANSIRISNYEYLFLGFNGDDGKLMKMKLK